MWVWTGVTWTNIDTVKLAISNKLCWILNRSMIISFRNGNHFVYFLTPVWCVTPDVRWSSISDSMQVVGWWFWDGGNGVGWGWERGVGSFRYAYEFLIMRALTCKKNRIFQCMANGNSTQNILSINWLDEYKKLIHEDKKLIHLRPRKLSRSVYRTILFHVPVQLTSVIWTIIYFNVFQINLSSSGLGL